MSPRLAEHSAAINGRLPERDVQSELRCDSFPRALQVSMDLFVGCAGWTIPATERRCFPATGSQLERYSTTLSCVEINSTFYRSHRPTTYARWAESTPAGFRFAVKVPKIITHQRRLVDAGDPLQQFLDEVQFLGSQLGPLLVQLPPSLAFNASVVASFFSQLRGKHDGLFACEPRHPSWFSQQAHLLLQEYEIARVEAGPAILPEVADVGGSRCLRYLRLHGAPKMYYSAYEHDFLVGLSERLRMSPVAAETWCIFDNTAEGAAIRNALELSELLGFSTTPGS